MTPKPKKRTIQSVERALNILNYISRQINEKKVKGVSISEISKEFGLGKSTIHGLVSTLEQMDYLSQDEETLKYTMGFKLFELGQIFQNNLDLRDIMHPYMVQLSASTGETVHSAVLSGGEVLYIDKVNSPHAIGMISQIGGRNSAHCTGVGKMLLSGLTDEEIDELYEGVDLVRHTKNTITDLEDLKERIAEIREKGYCFDLEEIEEGLHCIAAPVRDYHDNIVAAFSISGPKTRLPMKRLESLIDEVKDASRHISYHLGNARR